MLIASGVLFGAGVALQWSATAATGRLNPDSSARAVPPYVIANVFGGAAMLEGVIFSGLGSMKLGRARPNDLRASRRMRGVGGAMTGVGLLGLLGTGLLWPQIRERCPIREGCAIAGLQASAAHLTVGTGLLAYGAAINPDSGPSLPKRATIPLALGATAFTVGYLNAAFIGMRTSTHHPDPAGRAATPKSDADPVRGPDDRGRRP